MIPREPAARETAPEAMRRHLLESWAGVRRPQVPLQVSEAASAVATYCVHDLDRRALSQAHLDLLFSRALCRAGDREAARRMLGEAGGDDLAAASCLAMLDGADRPWPAVDWMARRVYRASRYRAFPEGVCWVLDWARLHPSSGALLEVSYVGLLQALIRELAPLWDPTSGRGTLLHHGLARHLSRAMPAPRARQSWSGELCAWSRALLARAASTRGWVEVPACRIGDAAY